MGKLGHIPHKDSRDALHGMGTELTGITTPASKIWKRGDTLDQGVEGACVGFGWTAWHNCKPWGFHKQKGNDFAFDWYHAAQEIDPWEGNDYEGTTVRAGAKLAEGMGILTEYVWAQSQSELTMWLLTKGPVVVASTWYTSMDMITSSNELFVTPLLGERGGHCYMLYGYEDGMYHFQNSWGDSYGDYGTFYMDEDQLTTLWNYGSFEAVTARQVKAVE